MKVVIRLEALSKEAKESIALETDDQNLLAALSKDEEVLVREGVAKNKNTNELILQELAKDEDIIVRLGVAGNVQASISTLDQLASDDNADIRLGVASNMRTCKQ